MKISAAHKVARVLNAMTEVGGIHTVAKLAKVSNSLVFEVVKDFPLWDYYRMKIRGPRSDDSS